MLGGHIVGAGTLAHLFDNASAKIPRHLGKWRGGCLLLGDSYRAGSGSRHFIVARDLNRDVIGARVVVVVGGCNSGQHHNVAVRIHAGNHLVRLSNQRGVRSVGHKIVLAPCFDSADDVVHVGVCDIAVGAQLRGSDDDGHNLVPPWNFPCTTWDSPSLVIPRVSEHKMCV